MKELFRYRDGAGTRTVTIETETGEALDVQVASADGAAGSGASWRIVRAEGPRFDLELEGGRRVRAYVVSAKERVFVHVDGVAYALPRVATGGARRSGGRAAAEPGLEAPMPGQVRALLVAEGDDVAEGDTLVVLEAMKMELRVRAPHAGKVTKLACAVGDVVERGQVLALVG